MKPKKLFKNLKIKINPQLFQADITGISANSKRIKKGNLFVAIEGVKIDGHRFVGEALKKGARIAVVEREENAYAGLNNVIKVPDARKALSVAAKNFYYSPSEKLKTIGVTGTNGKTTTSILIRSIFNRASIPCGLIGTIDYRIGKRRIPAERTTPDAIYINILLDMMLKKGLKAAVMEVSSHALDQKRVDDIFFDAAIFTNLTHEHLDYHLDLERYFASKTKIFHNLKKGARAIINGDDPRASRIKKLVGKKAFIYSLNGSCGVSARIKEANLSGSIFTVRINKKDAFSIKTKLVGLHNVSNILAAAAACLTQGIDTQTIKKGIEKVHTIQGRFEHVPAKGGFKVFIDYAHTPEALKNILVFLNRMKKRNIITVFGCGGERDSQKRPLMGCFAQRLSDYVIITSDNPRNEDPKNIIRDIEMGMDKNLSDYSMIPDRKKAIEKALKRAKNADIVLIAGKGHETVQVVGKEEMPFSDKKVVKDFN